MCLHAIEISGSGVKLGRFEVELTTGEIIGQPVFKNLHSPDWENFEQWLAPHLEQAGDLAVATTGLINPLTRIVRFGNSMGWKDRPLCQLLERATGKKILSFLGNAEAHLAAHLNKPKPSMAIKLDQSVEFALANETGIARPRLDINYDIGECNIFIDYDTDHSAETWEILNRDAFNDLVSNWGEEGAQRYGERLGVFLARLASIFQPRTILLSGSLNAEHGADFAYEARQTFDKVAPYWLERPTIILSPFGENAGLIGLCCHSTAILQGLLAPSIP